MAERQLPIPLCYCLLASEVETTLGRAGKGGSQPEC